MPSTAAMSLRDCVVDSWEATWGREGLWCRICRHCTPLAVLSVDVDGEASLECECCGHAIIPATPWYGGTHDWLAARLR